MLTVISESSKLQYVVCVIALAVSCFPFLEALNGDEPLPTVQELSVDISQSSPWHAHSHQDSTGSHVLTFNVTVDAVTFQESNFFIKKIFSRYGSYENMTTKNLESLVHNLGLGTFEGLQRKKRALDLLHPEHKHTSHAECTSVDEMLDVFHLGTYPTLTAEQFSYLCPAFVYQLDLHVCKQQQSDLLQNLSEKNLLGLQPTTQSEAIIQDKKPFDISDIPAKVWGFSTVAVIVISLVGLLGVAVIPIMQKVFYNHLLQFLVALAVGALSGDALLHLLPHAIMASTEAAHADGNRNHDHSSGAYRGLVALCGILFFFVTERLLTIITVIKRDLNSKKQSKKKRCEEFCDIERNRKSVGSRMSYKQSGEDECDRMVMLIHPNKALKSFADAAHDEYMHQCDVDGNSLMSDKAEQPTKIITYKDQKTSEVPEELTDLAVNKSFSGLSHSHSSHGHSHSSHGHSHIVPNSVAAVAWMVILGDGIHNFSDGLAIGAAFANSVTGGFSTSIAVFCHELPHEIGDFAVLLRAGMPVKQAILYNCLSSLLCFIGMLIGVAIGNIAEASLWIFAVVGGMFLYIALVDMLPEMSSVDPKKGENPFLHLLLQVLGMLLGSGIMLVIAVFEHDIKNALE